MSKYKFELNRSGVRALLRSDEVKAILKSKADAAAQACGWNPWPFWWSRAV